MYKKVFLCSICLIAISSSGLAGYVWIQDQKVQSQQPFGPSPDFGQQLVPMDHLVVWIIPVPVTQPVTITGVSLPNTPGVKIDRVRITTGLTSSTFYPNVISARYWRPNGYQMKSSGEFDTVVMLRVTKKGAYTLGPIDFRVRIAHPIFGGILGKTTKKTYHGYGEICAGIDLASCQSAADKAAT